MAGPEGKGRLLVQEQEVHVFAHDGTWTYTTALLSISTAPKLSSRPYGDERLEILQDRE